jgi:hypothetical protein
VCGTRNALQDYCVDITVPFIMTSRLVRLQVRRLLTFLEFRRSESTERGRNFGDWQLFTAIGRCDARWAHRDGRTDFDPFEGCRDCLGPQVSTKLHGVPACITTRDSVSSGR